MDTQDQKKAPAGFNTTDLAASIAKHFGMPKAQALRIMSASFTLISNAVARGEIVRLHSFGNFKPLATSERKGRNPQTGEETVIQASIRPHFVASQNFKDKVKDGKEESLDLIAPAVAQPDPADAPAQTAKPKAAPKARPAQTKQATAKGRIPAKQKVAAPAAAPLPEVEGSMAPEGIDEL